jgi:hypothetical protein
MIGVKYHIIRGEKMNNLFVNRQLQGQDVILKTGNSLKINTLDVKNDKEEVYFEDTVEISGAENLTKIRHSWECGGGPTAETKRRIDITDNDNEMNLMVDVNENGDLTVKNPGKTEEGTAEIIIPQAISNPADIMNIRDGLSKYDQQGVKYVSVTIRTKKTPGTPEFVRLESIHLGSENSKNRYEFTSKKDFGMSLLM